MTASRSDAIDSILAERGRTHGDYRDHAAVTQAIKDIYRGHKGWERLTACQRETLDMLAHKIGRILAGDPSHQDHWDDIAGYARLVSKEIAGPDQATRASLGVFHRLAEAKAALEAEVGVNAR